MGPFAFVSVPSYHSTPEADGGLGLSVGVRWYKGTHHAPGGVWPAHWMLPENGLSAKPLSLRTRLAQSGLWLFNFGGGQVSR